MKFACYYCEYEFDEPESKEVSFTIPEAFNREENGKKYIGICPFCKSTRIIKL